MNLSDCWSLLPRRCALQTAWLATLTLAFSALHTLASVSPARAGVDQVVAQDAINQHYRDMSVEDREHLGWSKGSTKQCRRWNCAYKQYEHGRIYYSDEYGAKAVYGAIYALWMSLGGQSPDAEEFLMFTGNPMTDEQGTPDGRGRYVHFEWSASIYWTPETGAQLVQGDVLAAWAQQGWEMGPAGYPVRVGNDGRCGNHPGAMYVGHYEFEGGFFCKVTKRWEDGPSLLWFTPYR